MIDYCDPRSGPSALPEPYGHRIDLAAALTVGLVANGFPDSEAFLDELERSLARQLPTASFRRWNKRNASAPITDAMLAEVTSVCDAVVGAYGH